MNQSEIGCALPSVFSRDKGRTNLTGRTSVQYDLPECEAKDDLSVNHDSDDELAIDLAKAALETGTHACEAAAWYEADSVLRDSPLAAAVTQGTSRILRHVRSTVQACSMRISYTRAGGCQRSTHKLVPAASKLEYIPTSSLRCRPFSIACVHPYGPIWSREALV